MNNVNSTAHSNDANPRRPSYVASLTRAAVAMDHGRGLPGLPPASRVITRQKDELCSAPITRIFFSTITVLYHITSVNN